LFASTSSSVTPRGSWLVRISLAQVGRWLVDRGEVPKALEGVPKEIPQADIYRWSIESDTPVGRLRHLGPTVRLSETPPRRGGRGLRMVPSPAHRRVLGIVRF
jgi:hypothetical protein